VSGPGGVPGEVPPNEPGLASTSSERQKRILAAVLVVHALLATLTVRDLRCRPAAAVRGPKWLWRTWAVLNTTGSAAYWLFGRRRVS
jgi:hypothetical protein